MKQHILFGINNHAFSKLQRYDFAKAIEKYSNNSIHQIEGVDNCFWGVLNVSSQEEIGQFVMLYLCQAIKELQYPYSFMYFIKYEGHNPYCGNIGPSHL